MDTAGAAKGVAPSLTAVPFESLGKVFSRILSVVGFDILITFRPCLALIINLETS